MQTIIKLLAEIPNAFISPLVFIVRRIIYLFIHFLFPIFISIFFFIPSHSLLFVCVPVSDESCFYVCVCGCVRADPIHTNTRTHKKNRTHQSITQYLYCLLYHPNRLFAFPTHSPIFAVSNILSFGVLFWFGFIIFVTFLLSGIIAKA